MLQRNRPWPAATFIAFVQAFKKRKYEIWRCVCPLPDRIVWICIAQSSQFVHRHRWTIFLRMKTYEIVCVWYVKLVYFGISVTYWFISFNFSLFYSFRCCFDWFVKCFIMTQHFVAPSQELRFSILYKMN